MTGGKSSEEAFAEEEAVENVPMEDLKACLEEIKGYEGVIGYILRNSQSASIDLKDSSKLIEYAILSSASLDAWEELSQLFNLGEVNNITIEGENIKVLSMVFGENKVSVFTEKATSLEKISEKLNSLRGLELQP
ncbi:MAG: hypothetical protein RMJ15_07525 [Nitrososphaerota archaeon]|nr:hypothetical protein [Candidatus Bathyarchaeota archaeon]MDW8023566.1 hypothetical protein [Nitrososphaerota archaeon]